MRIIRKPWRNYWWKLRKCFKSNIWRSFWRNFNRIPEGNSEETYEEIPEVKHWSFPYRIPRETSWGIHGQDLLEKLYKESIEKNPNPWEISGAIRGLISEQIVGQLSGSLSGEICEEFPKQLSLETLRRNFRKNLEIFLKNPRISFEGKSRLSSERRTSYKIDFCLVFQQPNCFYVQLRLPFPMLVVPLFLNMSS